MRKLTLRMLVIALLATVFASCGKMSGALGMNDIDMDKEEAVTKVKEVITKNVDATKWKIVEISWSESDKLSNSIGYINLQLVDKEGNISSQSFSLNNEHEFVANEVKESITPKVARNTLVFEEVKGIDVNKLDGQQILKQLEAAKALIPADYNFKSIESYNITEDVRRLTKMSHLSKIKDTKVYGKQNVNLKINTTKKEEGTEVKGRQIITNYYTIPFIVKEDGSVEIRE